MARGLKFRIKKVKGLYYLCSENKGADQLRGYREADLRPCFHRCKKPVFSRRSSYKPLHEMMVLMVKRRLNDNVFTILTHKGWKRSTHVKNADSLDSFGIHPIDAK